MKPSKQYQWPSVEKYAGNGEAFVRTYVGETPYEIRNRVSPRISEETRDSVWVAQLKQLQEIVPTSAQVIAV